MYVDAFLQFSDAQALTASGASTNTVDFGSDRNVGVGEPMVVAVVLDAAADDADADETYSVALEADSTDAFGSATTLSSFSLPRGAAAGSKFALPVPPVEIDSLVVGGGTGEGQFFRLNFTLGGTTPSVTVTAFLIPQSMLQNDFVYPDNITIS